MPIDDAHVLLSAIEHLHREECLTDGEYQLARERLLSVFPNEVDREPIDPAMLPPAKVLEAFRDLVGPGIVTNDAYPEGHRRTLELLGVPTPKRTAAHDADVPIEPYEPSLTERMLDWTNNHVLKTPVDFARVWSYDWCRYRRDSHCYYPDYLDRDATALAGYQVTIPLDRGNCWRMKWHDQELCPVAEPGPNTQDPNRALDATVAWIDGGQRTIN